MTLSIKTPAVIYDSSSIREQYENLLSVEPRIRLLFPLKSCSISEVLRLVSQYVEGFACSSEFETLLVKNVIGSSVSIHTTSPSLTTKALGSLAAHCDVINANSINQLSSLCRLHDCHARLGVRINPGLSFVQDERYDPCRADSKLGIRIDQLLEFIKENHHCVDRVSGALIHSNCESSNFEELHQTVKIFDKQMPDFLEEMEWINLGGGYLYDSNSDWEPLVRAVDLLSQKYNLDVYFEPGRAIVGDAGVIVSSVVDITESGKKKIAILDTSVNHMPEVFEYQYRPDIKEESASGRYQYVLAGSTCLAGDVFGEYRFEKPLEIGSRITFLDMGAYTLVKAHWFNGIGLPSVYILRESGELELIKEYCFENYLSHCGALENATV